MPDLVSLWTALKVLVYLNFLFISHNLLRSLANIRQWRCWGHPPKKVFVLTWQVVSETCLSTTWLLSLVWSLHFDVAAPDTDVCLTIEKHLLFYAARFSKEHLITRYSSLKCLDAAKFTAKHALCPVAHLPKLLCVLVTLTLYHRRIRAELNKAIPLNWLIERFSFWVSKSSSFCTTTLLAYKLAPLFFTSLEVKPIETFWVGQSATKLTQGKRGF